VEHYDLVIIGSGSGNSILTPEFDDWRIAIVDEGTFGGTCLNVGCVPTKMYVYAADVADTVRDAARYGVDAQLTGVRWPDIRGRIFGRIDPISANGREYRRTGANTTLYEAHAKFQDAHTLRFTTGAALHAEHIVIAAGSRVNVPPAIAESGVPFHTSDTIMRIPELPRRLAIVGGGYIAAEFAHIFGALGTEVTIISRFERLLRHLDGEISRRFTALARDRWTVHLGHEAQDVTGDASGVRLTLRDGRSVEADLLLVATGRTPNSDRLDLPTAGIDVHSDGRVVVDEFLQTTADGVWAMGDIRSVRQLKHVANQDARVVRHNLLHPDDRITIDDHNVPAAVFTHPQIASVGLTEEAAREGGHDVVTAVYPYGGIAFGWAMEDTTSICKVVADRRSGELLGGHVLGPQASTVIQPIVQALAFGLRPQDVARRQYWIHPALAEVVENALLALDL
jgi:mycothione reductase